MRHLTLTLLSVAAVTACTSIQIVEAPRVTESIGTEPKIGETTTAQVGSTLFSQYRLWKKTGTRIPAGFVGEVGGAQVIVTSYDYLIQSVADGQLAYCTERLTMRNLLGVPTKTTCFAGTTSDSRFTKVMVPADAIWWSKPLSAPLRYEQQDEIITRPESIRRELIYLGTSGRVMRLAYREYAGDLARPAFAQEVTDDVVDLPMQVTFKSSRFEVLAIGGSSITYRATSPL
jgi:hypothetical protein